MGEKAHGTPLHPADSAASAPQSAVDTETVTPPAPPAAPGDQPCQKYELAFPDGLGGGQDVVEVSITSRTGAGGHPVYEDDSGIIQAEISDLSEVRILATGARQETVHGVTAHPVA
ncbi:MULTISPECIES: DUF6296 family protein [unclassified Streptomyces]|uniref:DUF6296 family protein n=1 Tax=unclassified Streptomyces TaxID=2593676 RepID=UPI00381A114E